MKLLPIPLSPLTGAPPLGMWNSDLLWRYPSTPPSPLAELKSQLPSQLSSDPRLWGREEVIVFLRWTEREFDLPKFELDLFQMNGKALCLLTKNDLGERCPGAGDIIHNVLQLLIRDAQMIHRHMPSSPITPTNRYPLSPHSHPPTPNWNTLAPPENFYAHHLQQFLTSNSVTLSPAPSIDSQAGSPPQQSSHEATSTSSQIRPNSNEIIKTNASDSSETRSSGSDSTRITGTSSGSSSHQSDSEEEKHYLQEGGSHKIPKLLPPPLHHKHLSKSSVQKQQQNHSPPITPNSANSNSNNPLFASTPDYKQNIFFNGSFESFTNNGNASGSNSASNPPTPTPTTPGYLSIKREFFPDTSSEPSTNGRLLWDFLQQLLNDHQQRYSNYIAWKCRDTGVFKIVDPAGLAKLWGIQKNHLSMNYDKMSRALRYYYRVNILRKVQGERHCYQFLRNPTELKSIKNISLLRQSMSSHPNNHHPTSSQTTTSNNCSQPSTATIASLNASTSLQHLANALVNANNLKENFKQEDEKPTDLSTSSMPKSADCYPLIRNTNGLTTIQLLRHNQNHDGTSSSPSSSPTSLSPPIHYLNLSKDNNEDMLPADLRKNFN